MKKLLLAIVVHLSFSFVYSQTITELQETAKSFMRQGDYANAILVLNRAVQMEPQNIAVLKDLSLNLYYQGDYDKALETLKPVLDMPQADDQSFQIAGSIYRQSGRIDDAEKMYKKGLKKFPKSGILYNDLGEAQWRLQSKDAIKNWEKGIETEPSYSRNYFNAARYYYYTGNTVWGLLYAEIFLNMDPFGANAQEMKQLLLDGYKQLFKPANIEQGNTDKNPFIIQYLQCMNKQSALVSTGVNTASLAMVRARFVLDWFAQNKNYPYRLFEYQQQLLREGLFDAYNQWLFGTIQNLPAYQNWTNTHPEESKAFYHFQKSRVFKIPPGQYYH